jgi:hypothetical protein
METVKYYCLKDDPTKDLYIIDHEFSSCVTLFSPKKNDFEIIDSRDKLEIAPDHLVIAAKLKGELDNQPINVWEEQLKEQARQFQMQQAMDEWGFQQQIQQEEFKQLITKGFNI